jgi:hypothetical protein
MNQKTLSSGNYLILKFIQNANKNEESPLFQTIKKEDRYLPFLYLLQI